jgi:hypothetical protein
MNGDEISLSLTREQAEGFLEKLEEDDDFRARLVQGGDETRAALSEIGIEVPVELIPEKVVLPEREHIQHFRTAEGPEEELQFWIDIFWIDIGLILLLFARGFQRRS